MQDVQSYTRVIARIADIFQYDSVPLVYPLSCIEPNLIFKSLTKVMAHQLADDVGN